ncbi:MAG: PH domain-containing protein [Pseudonocardiaceae bacterium]
MVGRYGRKDYRQDHLPSLNATDPLGVTATMFQAHQWALYAAASVLIALTYGGLLGVLIGPIFGRVVSQRARTTPVSAFALWPLSVLVAAGAALFVVARASSTRVQIAQGRVRISRRLIVRSMRAVELFKVQSVELRQGVINWATGDGALVLSTGESQPLVLLGVAPMPQLERMANQLQDLVLALRRNRSL